MVTNSTLLGSGNHSVAAGHNTTGPKNSSFELPPGAREACIDVHDVVVVRTLCLTLVVRLSL
jgi:hypothetical protein